ncbi:hypothetical protein [Nocardia macrotermitis]|uniref:Uncharacterized protein n=1 Tax=Nocardia macrotermitis TaxID=2585198 RepID=A0A7K0DDG3_9NOCA|nr:hypothetical protein [Nocardia macrotermitis]MQY23649.1 hypothetical protein [Nocardia macrotermitis]
MTTPVKVFTPIKRVPTMIGKAQNGQKLPFGPYTLPQIAGGATLLVISSVCAMVLPINAAVTFVVGLAVTGVSVFGLGLVPYTGVRMTSRVLWVGRLIFVRKPVSASGVPIDVDSADTEMFVEESVVVILPGGEIERAAAPRWPLALSGSDSAAIESGGRD